MSVALGIGATALMLLDALQNGDLLYLADDEQEAEAVADALMSFAPDDHVVFLPSSDTLPGDGAPSTPSNIGKRVAALLPRDNQDERAASIKMRIATC
ncbi:hypothetical protein ACFOKF_23085 [Sphingobium rhizovicinum]|uniref:Uncharacterized protein n=1 Tax=Sphingobium rhizovicinum TaxID=432308 RepID=A0ABV7NMH5_9SPHN